MSIFSIPLRVKSRCCGCSLAVSTAGICFASHGGRGVFPLCFAFELKNPSTFSAQAGIVSSALYEGRDLERGDNDGLFPVRRPGPALSAISASPEEFIPAATPGQGEGGFRVCALVFPSKRMIHAETQRYRAWAGFSLAAEIHGRAKRADRKHIGRSPIGRVQCCSLCVSA